MIDRAVSLGSSLVRTAVLLAMLAGTAAAAEDDRIEPDRPDVTDGAKAVGGRVVQVESGLEYSRTSFAAGADERRLAVQLLGRVGVLDRLELRIGGEPLVHLADDGEHTGAGDALLGFKYQFTAAREDSFIPALGVSSFVKIPSATEPIGSERADVAAIGLASFDLPGGVGLDVNAGVVAVGQSHPSGYLLQALASGSLSVEVAERLSPFVELFFASRDEWSGGNEVGIGTGLTYWLTRDLTVDAAVYTSLLGQAPDYLIRTGMSVRFNR